MLLYLQPVGGERSGHEAAPGRAVQVACRTTALLAGIRCHAYHFADVVPDAEDGAAHVLRLPKHRHGAVGSATDTASARHTGQEGLVQRDGEGLRLGQSGSLGGGPSEAGLAEGGDTVPKHGLSHRHLRDGALVEGRVTGVIEVHDGATLRGGATRLPIAGYLSLVAYAVMAGMVPGHSCLAGVLAALHRA